jgi:hypothetical protein
MIHTVRRHGGRIEDVVVLEVDVCECARAQAPERAFLSPGGRPAG